MTLWKITLYFLIIATLKFNIRNNFVTGYLQYDDVPEEDPYVCTKPECYHIASKLISNMNTSVDPCDNFYEFACGNYENQMQILFNEGYIDGYTEITQLVKRQLRNLFVVPSAPHDNKFSQISKTLYQSCIDESSAIKRKYERLQARLGTAGFDWPILYHSEFDDVNFTWTQAVDVLVNADVEFANFFDLIPGMSYPDGTRDILLKIPTQRHFQRHFAVRFENAFATAYWKFMIDIVMILGAPREIVTTECQNVINFEIELSKIIGSVMEEKAKQLHITPEYITFGDLKKNYTKWKDYFEKMSPIIGYVRDRDVINVEFYSHVSSLLSLLDSTPKRTIANYIMWKAFDDEELEDFETPLTAFNEFLKVAMPEAASSLFRSDLCVNSVINLVTTTILYTNKFISDEVKDVVSTIMVNVRDEIVETLKKTNWVELEELLSAVKRINTMKSIIGYPNDIVNSTILEQYYNDLQLDSDDYFGNVEILQFIGREYNYFNRSMEKPSSVDTETNTYSMSDNQLILYLMFFNIEYPQYINYAEVGSIIGYEIIHNFDINNWGTHGQYKDEYTSGDRMIDTNYRKKMTCLTRQYDKYFVPEVGEYINGTQTRNENIADSGSFKMAYLTYKRWAQIHGTEKMLPGLPYSPNQLFWINAASLHCGKYQPKFLDEWVSTGHYTPNEFRVIGSFSNYAEFAKDFNCTVGSNMNPEEKCVIW